MGFREVDRLLVDVIGEVESFGGGFEPGRGDFVLNFIEVEVEEVGGVELGRDGELQLDG